MSHNKFKSFENKMETRRKYNFRVGEWDEKNEVRLQEIEKQNEEKNKEMSKKIVILGTILERYSKS